MPVCYCYTSYEMTDQFFYDFRRKWTATVGIGIQPAKTWLSQLVNFKNAIWTLEERYAIKFCFKLGEMPCDESWIYCYDPETKREFPVEACWLSQTQEGQTDQIHPQTFDYPSFFWQHWHDLHALGSHWTDSQQGILCWGLREFRKRFLGKRPALFKSGQRHFHQDNAPVHNSILITDYLSKMGIKTVPHPLYSPYLAPCDFCLFPKLRGCPYETIEEMKEAVTKVIDRLTQEDFHGAPRSFCNGTSALQPEEITSWVYYQ